MKNLKDYKIKFSGLNLGEHSFDYQLNNEFFKLFEYQDFEESDLFAEVLLRKKTNSLELQISIKGTVTVPCDLTTELYRQPIDGSAEVMVKFGEEYDDSNEEVLILPHGEHELNVAQYLYETAVLAVPLKHVSPDAEKSEAGKEIREKLENLSPEAEDEKSTDPRWDKLKNLLN